MCVSAKLNTKAVRAKSTKKLRDIKIPVPANSQSDRRLRMPVNFANRKTPDPEFAPNVEAYETFFSILRCPRKQERTCFCPTQR